MEHADALELLRRESNAHTAQVCRRQHTLAYVSIRQHTSAYASELMVCVRELAVRYVSSYTCVHILLPHMCPVLVYEHCCIGVLILDTAAYLSSYAVAEQYEDTCVLYMQR